MARRIDNKRTSRGYGNVLSSRGRGSVLLPFRERREYVPVGSLSDVLSSRVPEGQNTDPRPQLEKPPARNAISDKMSP